MGARSIRVAAAGVVLLMVLRTCAVFCVVSAESTEQTFNVSQRDGELLSRVDENIDGVVDQYMSSTADEAGSAEEFNGESYDDDEDAVSVGIDQRSGSQRRFLVQKKEKPAHHGGHCWKDAQCRSHHYFRKPGCCKKCVDLYSDAMHCGKCGEKCKAGYRCDEGKCKKLPEPKRCGVHAECKKGSTCCENKCVKLNGSDKFNCGKCGRKCGFGSVCCTGECKYIFRSDAEHCGGCHKRCKHGVKCTYGICGYN